MNMAVIVLLGAIVLVAAAFCIAAVRRRRLVTAAAVAMVALVVASITVLVTIQPRNGPAMSGGVTLEADPGVRFYVGERLVGTGEVFMPWDDLVGSDGKQPLAIKLEAEDSFPDVFKQKHHGVITAEGLGGRGAVLIQRSNQFASKHGNDIQHIGEQILLRRADGMLDWVLVMIGECRAMDGQRLRFLVPIRVRQNLGYLITHPNDGSGGPRGHYIDPPIVRPTLHLSWRFVTGGPQGYLGLPNPFPDELAEEIKEKGLWEPANR